MKASPKPHTIKAETKPRSRNVKNAIMINTIAGAASANQSRRVIFRMRPSLAELSECPQLGACGRSAYDARADRRIVVVSGRKAVYEQVRPISR